MLDNHNKIYPYITIGGIGSRLKTITNLEKYNLYYLNKTILEHTTNILPDSNIVGHTKTNSRKETFEQIQHRYNVLIIDCDIIPFQINLKDINMTQDNVYIFESDKNKYGSINFDTKFVITEASEDNNISKYKCSGVYFCKDLHETLKKMKHPDSIVSGMLGAKAILENTFKRFGDVEDYYEAIGL
jgi:hypothetical protein